ncbi:PilZ domain-containing protein [Sphingobium algorifonticola]|nr:PilZ domain-containing protein [Sphingobium algorifonticola]
MQAKRGRVRVAVDVPVTITTVLDSIEATVINLSEAGAQVTGAILPKGTDFQLDCEGHTTFAKVMWVEHDRMGVRFPYALTEGPLHDALQAKQTGRDLRGSLPLAAARRPTFAHFGRNLR